jgi:uncharacterized membrane protein
LSTPFWIAHHPEEQRCRCVRLFGFDVCARCLGLYPLLFVLLGIEMAVSAPLLQAFEPWILTGLTLPSLFDWARGRFEPSSGNNAVRIATGALLACALARTLWFHMVEPLNTFTSAHLSWILLTAALVEITATVRKARQREPRTREALEREIQLLSDLCADSLMKEAAQPEAEAGGIEEARPQAEAVIETENEIANEIAESLPP